MVDQYALGCVPISHFLAPWAPAGSEIGRCGVCGISGAGMYRRQDILDTAGSNITTLFPHNTPVMCRHCVALWKVPKHWHRGIFATPDATYFPLIATGEQQSPARPLWRELLSTPARWQETACVAVLTTDPKKRVWPHARVSQGARLLLYVHDPSRGISSNRWVTWTTLAQTLILVEQALGLGATKAQIAQTLYLTNLIKTHGLAPVQVLETHLAPARHTPEFVPALIVAQKPEEITL